MRQNKTRRCGHQRGVTLPELLVVLSIAALIITVSIPFVSATVQRARAQAAVRNFAVTVKAVRMAAVTSNTVLDLRVQSADLDSWDGTTTWYEFPKDSGGVQRVEMPRGVWIDASTDPIRFRPDGAVTESAETRIQVDVGPGRLQTWTIRTSIAGSVAVEVEDED